MRILIVANAGYPLHKSKSEGGIEAVCVGVRKALTKHTKIKVDILAPDDSTIDDFIPMGSKSATYYLKRGERDKFKVPVYSDAMSDVVRGISQYDIVMSNVLNTVMNRRLAETGADIVYVIHGHMVYQQDYHYYKSIYEIKKEYSNFKVIGVSEWIQRHMNAKFPDMVDDYVHWTFAEPEFFCKKPEPFIAYVGRIQSDKRVMRAVKAFAGIEGFFSLRLMGEVFKYSDYTQRFYEDELIPYLDSDSNIRMADKVYTHKSLWSAVSKATAVIIPRRQEAWCLAGFEAQKMGVPIIVLGWKEPCGPSEYMIDGETGILVPAFRKRENEVLERIREAAEACATMDREHIRDTFQKYSEKKFAKRFVKVITGVHK